MSDLPITAGDMIVVGVLLISGLLAFARGLVQELLSVAAWVGALVAAYFGYPYAAPYLTPYLPDPRLANIASGVAVFLVAIIVLWLLTRSIAKTVQGSALNALDRSLGFVFGLARGALLIVLLYIVVEFFVKEDQQPDWLRDARSRPLVAYGANYLSSFVSAEQLEDDVDAARRAAEEARNLLETEKKFRELMSPTPKHETSGHTAETEGYGAKERSDMERLIDSSQGRP